MRDKDFRRNQETKPHLCNKAIGRLEVNKGWKTVANINHRKIGVLC